VGSSPPSRLRSARSNPPRDLLLTLPSRIPKSPFFFPQQGQTAKNKRARTLCRLRIAELCCGAFSSPGGCQAVGDGNAGRLNLPVDRKAPSAYYVRGPPYPCQANYRANKQLGYLFHACLCVKSGENRWPAGKSGQPGCLGHLGLAGIFVVFARASGRMTQTAGAWPQMAEARVSAHGLSPKRQRGKDLSLAGASGWDLLAVTRV